MKSIMQVDDKCYACGCAYGSDWHHIYPGNPNRKHSEEWGLKVRLCRPCHEEIHCKNSKRMKELQKAGQAKFEETHTREEFRAIFGMSWL